MKTNKCSLCGERPIKITGLCTRCYGWMQYHRNQTVSRTVKYLGNHSRAARRIKATYGTKNRMKK